MDALSPNKRYCKIRKRKTRKCLNEIRSRCHQGGDKNMDSIKVTKKTTQRLTAAPRSRPNILKANGSNITKARLTIQHGIFAKGVRSETITRPELSQEFRARMDENLYKIIDLANGQPKHTLTSGNNQETNTVSTRLSSSDMEIEVDLLNRSNKDIFNLEETFPFSVHKNVVATRHSSSCSLPKEITCTASRANTSPLCITPPNKNIPTEKKSSNVAVANIILNSTSDSDMDEKHYELYKEFNDMLPSYLNKYLPISNAEEIENELKSYLKDVYKESCQRESEKNILECITNRQKRSPCVSNAKSIMKQTMEQSILLNPIQYLKQVHHYQFVNDTNSIRDICQKNSYNLDNSLKCRKIQKLDEPGCSHYSNKLYVSPDPVQEILQLSLSSDSSDKQITKPTSPVFDTHRNHEDNSLITIADESPEITYYPRKIN